MIIYLRDQQFYFSHTISNLNTTNPCRPSRSPSPLAVLASMQGLVAYDGRPLIHVDPQDWTAINRNKNDDGMEFWSTFDAIILNHSPRNKLILGVDS